MIAKLIHYCWFGKGIMPSSQKDYIKSWKRYMPGYKIKFWNESNFDINCNVYVRNAYQNKKYAFVSDYARLIALNTEGGFYLDTDIEVFQSFNHLAEHKFVSAIEYFPEFKDYTYLLNSDMLPKENCAIIPFLGFLSAFIGSEPGNGLISDMINYYDRITPDHPDYNGTVIDGVMAREAIKYGFRYIDTYQELEHNMVIYPSTLFCSMLDQVSKKSYLLHHCAQSWQPKTKIQQFQLQLDKVHLLKAYKLIAGLKKKVALSVNRD